METDIVGTILSVLGRATSNGKTIYDIAFSDGNTYTTFDGKVAGKAQALQGQQVSARVKAQQKGQYTNLYFNDVELVGQLPPQAQPAAAGTPVQVPGVANAIPVTPAPAIPMVQNESEQKKNARIAIQTATKVAGNVVASLFQGAGPEALEDAGDAVETLAKRFYGFFSGGSQQAASVAAQPVQAQTPEAVAAELNAEVPGAVAVGAPAEEGATLPWLA
jgi:hypothetical protein